MIMNSFKLYIYIYIYIYKVNPVKPGELTNNTVKNQFEFLRKIKTIFFNYFKNIETMCFKFILITYINFPDL
jgi:hypothetical protein